MMLQNLCNDLPLEILTAPSRLFHVSKVDLKPICFISLSIPRLSTTERQWSPWLQPLSCSMSFGLCLMCALESTSSEIKHLDTQCTYICSSAVLFAQHLFVNAGTMFANFTIIIHWFTGEQ